MFSKFFSALFALIVFSTISPAQTLSIPELKSIYLAVSDDAERIALNKNFEYMDVHVTGSGGEQETTTMYGYSIADNDRSAAIRILFIIESGWGLFKTVSYQTSTKSEYIAAMNYCKQYKYKLFNTVRSENGVQYEYTNSTWTIELQTTTGTNANNDPLTLYFIKLTKEG